MENVMIIGYGEIGKSVHRLYEGKLKTDYTVITKDSLDIIEVDGIHYSGQSATEIMKAYPIDVMHICFTYNENFIKHASKYIKKYEPELVIIHSTLAIGTTEKLYNEIEGISDLVHSPVMGKHPDLAESIKTFKKMIGPINYESGINAEMHLNKLDVTCELYDSSKDTEAAKLFSTTYYGTIIRYMQDVYRECEKENLNFEQVYTKTNKIYNEGYTKMGDTHFVRPVLTYMGKEGCGGHCVTPNAAILHQDNILETVAKCVLSLGYKNTDTYQNSDWLYAEYIGKEKSTWKIGEECGVSQTTIRNYMRKFGICARTSKWTEEEEDILKELSQEMTFKEIYDKNILNKTYNAIRIKASKLNISSCYDSGDMDEKTRKKISCTLRNIELEDFDYFKWTELNRINRKDYHDWRKLVFINDNFTCKKCHVKGGKLNSHHIIGYMDDEHLRFDVDNGATLCEDCHINFHKKYGYRHFTKEDFKEFLEEEDSNGTI